jgi:hypothetical protein
MEVPVEIGFVAVQSFPHMIGQGAQVGKGTPFEKLFAFRGRNPFPREYFLPYPFQPVASRLNDRLYLLFGAHR